MSRCIIIAPLYAGEDAEWLRRGEDDFLICADGGYDAAVRCGMKPDLTVGDFDSMPFAHVQEGAALRLPVISPMRWRMRRRWLSLWRALHWLIMRRPRWRWRRFAKSRTPLTTACGYRVSLF